MSVDRTAGGRVVRVHRARQYPFAAFRNHRGEWLDPSSITASDAKNEFARVLDMVVQGRVVVITKHDVPKAVLVSVEDFNALAQATESKLDTLSGAFDALLARMQTPKARAGMKAAFAASPKQLGKAAIAAARKRG
jgi:prevent-host-death family protein